jgi:hypothetical protein
VQVRQILVAQRGNPRVGQDVLQQRIAVRCPALLRIVRLSQNRRLSMFNGAKRLCCFQ